jgi:hypothetical protein
MKKTSWFQRMKTQVVSKNLNEGLEKASALDKPLQLGDFVVHTPSGTRGIITSLDRINGVDTLTFTDNYTGATRRGMARQECRLANSERNAWYHKSHPLEN